MPRLIQTLALACAFAACIALIWAPFPPVAAAVAMATAVILLAVALTRPSRNRRAAAWVAAGLALALSGCGTLQGMSSLDRRAVLAGAAEHIEKCDRDYWANTGLPGSAGFRITCRQPQDPAEMARAVAAAVKVAVSEALAGVAPQASDDAER